MPKKYTDEFLKEAKDYMLLNNLSLSKVANHFNVDRHTLGKRLREKYGEDITADNCSATKLEVDSNYFENINTEHKAYWLGFLTADGYVSSYKNDIELTLKEEDYDHIVKFKNDIKSNHKITQKIIELENKKHKAYRINIADKKINSDLNYLGLNSNKSYKSYIPFRFIPNELMPHYIRGLFDGDGSVCKANKNGTRITICTTASQMMVNDITEYIKKELDIDVKYGHSKDKNITNVCIYKQNDVEKFYNWIYKNATIYLNRKYNKFAVLRQNREKS